mgnify:CR=1 FL=1
MNDLNKQFKQERYFIKKKYVTYLLSELIWLDYIYSNNKYSNTSGEDIWNSLKNDTYSQKEKEQIIEDAISILKINHKKVKVVDFNDNIIK